MNEEESYEITKTQGTQDILPQESVKWQYVEEFARKTFKNIITCRNRTPLFEHYEVISRSVERLLTDIVTKKCMIFMTKATVISHYAQKEQHQLCVLVWRK